MKGWKGFKSFGAEIWKPSLRTNPKNMNECIQMCLKVSDCLAVNFDGESCSLFQNLLPQSEPDPDFITALRCNLQTRYTIIFIEPEIIQFNSRYSRDPDFQYPLPGGGFSCVCDSGYEGDGFSCSDIDECLSDICGESSECINSDGSYECLCQSGFQMSTENICKDIDECKQANKCSEFANCLNKQGSYACECKYGYDGDGKTCEDIDECVTENGGCDSQAECQNISGGRTCTCSIGYIGDGVTCQDEDECALGTNRCNPLSSKCENNDGSYSCLCRQGFVLNNNGICSNLNECDLEIDICHPHADCHDFPGLY